MGPAFCLVKVHHPWLSCLWLHIDMASDKLPTIIKTAFIPPHLWGITRGRISISWLIIRSGDSHSTTWPVTFNQHKEAVFIFWRALTLTYLIIMLLLMIMLVAATHCCHWSSWFDICIHHTNLLSFKPLLTYLMRPSFALCIIHTSAIRGSV